MRKFNPRLSGRTAITASILLAGCQAAPSLADTQQHPHAASKAAVAPRVAKTGYFAYYTGNINQNDCVTQVFNSAGKQVFSTAGWKKWGIYNCVNARISGTVLIVPGKYKPTGDASGDYYRLCAIDLTRPHEKPFVWPQDDSLHRTFEDVFPFAIGGQQYVICKERPGKKPGQLYVLAQNGKQLETVGTIWDDKDRQLSMPAVDADGAIICQVRNSDRLGDGILLRHFAVPWSQGQMAAAVKNNQPLNYKVTDKQNIKITAKSGPVYDPYFPVPVPGGACLVVGHDVSEAKKRQHDKIYIFDLRSGRAQLLLSGAGEDWSDPAVKKKTGNTLEITASMSGARPWALYNCTFKRDAAGLWKKQSIKPLRQHTAGPALGSTHNQP